MVRKLSITGIAALFGVFLASAASPVKGGISFVNNDPLVWELACDPAACTENLGQSATIEFSFSDFSDAIDADDKFLQMHISVTNNGIEGEDGDLTTLAMEMPTDIIESVQALSSAPGAPAVSGLPEGWIAGYDPEGANLNPFGPFDMCLRANDHPGADPLNCHSGPTGGVTPGQTATFNFLIGIDSTVFPTVSAVQYADANESFTGVEAFRGLFGDSIVNSDNADNQGACGHFQRIATAGDILYMKSSKSDKSSKNYGGGGSHSSKSDKSSKSHGGGGSHSSKSDKSDKSHGGGGSHSSKSDKSSKSHKGHGGGDLSDKVCGTLQQTASVPEPGSLPLLTLGVIAILGVGARRRLRG